MKINRNVRRAIERGATVYARVEAVAKRLVAVRLVGTGKRLTGLDFIGSRKPAAGDLVVLDYSSGYKPYVRLAESQVFDGEEYMDEAVRIHGMEPALTNPPDDGDPEMGGIDVGAALTTKVVGVYPNEPQQPDTAWTQYFGMNTGGWQSAIYDTADMDDGDPSGNQYFTVPTSGKYFVSVHTNLDINGSEGASPLGILRARVMRGYGDNDPVPVLVGIAGASEYRNQYNLNMSKIVFLPEGEQIHLELLYTGDQSDYYMGNSGNPLEWITQDNEIIIKIQLIAPMEVTELEPPEPPPSHMMTPAVLDFYDYAGVGGACTYSKINDTTFQVYGDNPFWLDVRCKGTLHYGSLGNGHLDVRLEALSGTGTFPCVYMIDSNPLEYTGWDPTLTDSTSPGDSMSSGDTKWIRGGGSKPFQTGYFNIRLQIWGGGLSACPGTNANITFRIVGMRWEYGIPSQRTTLYSGS